MPGFCLNTSRTGASPPFKAARGCFRSSASCPVKGSPGCALEGRGGTGGREESPVRLPRPPGLRRLRFPSSHPIRGAPPQQALQLRLGCSIWWAPGCAPRLPSPHPGPRLCVGTTSASRARLPPKTSTLSIPRPLPLRPLLGGCGLPDWTPPCSGLVRPLGPEEAGAQKSRGVGPQAGLHNRSFALPGKPPLLPLPHPLPLLSWLSSPTHHPLCTLYRGWVAGPSLLSTPFCQNP